MDLTFRANKEQRTLQDRGIDKMVEEARADNKDNDGEFMKPSGRSNCEYGFNCEICFTDERQDTISWNFIYLHSEGVVL